MEASDGTVVRAVVKEKTIAQEEFSEAVAEDRLAGIAYEVSPDVFVVSLGAIPVGLDVEVVLTVNDHNDDPAYRLTAAVCSRS